MFHWPSKHPNAMYDAFTFLYMLDYYILYSIQIYLSGTSNENALEGKDFQPCQVSILNNVYMDLF